MTKNIRVVRTVQCSDSEMLAKIASLVAASSTGWFADAAHHIAKRHIDTKPFSHIAYNPTVGYGYDLWHFGADTITAYYGKVDKLEPYISLTENEREHMLITQQKELAEGRQLLLIGHTLTKTTKTPPTQTTLAPGSLILDGILIVQYT